MASLRRGIERDYIGQVSRDVVRLLQADANPGELVWEAVAHGADVVQGKEMSFNNYVDADAAWQLVCDFDETACAIIKHTNPAGTAIGRDPEEAYRRALACDPTSAFGGIVAFNRTVDVAAAQAVVEIFVEVVIAPDFEDAAIQILAAKKNLRVLRTGQPHAPNGFEYKQISGGMLAQERDTHKLVREALKFVTTRTPSEKEIEDQPCVAMRYFSLSASAHIWSRALHRCRSSQRWG